MTQLDGSPRSFPLELEATFDLRESWRPSAVLGCLFVTTYHCGGQCHHHTAKAGRNSSTQFLWDCGIWMLLGELPWWFGMILVSNMLKHEKFQKFQVSSIPKKNCITLVGKFWMLAFPICPFPFSQKFIILTWRKFHWASLPKKYSMNQPFQLTLMFPFSMLSFTFPIDLYFLQIFVCWNLQLRWHGS